MNNLPSDPKTTSPGAPYRRTSDQLVSIQLLGTVCAIVFAFFGFQWQLSGLVSAITSQMTENKSEIKAIQEDLKEIREAVKELERTNRVSR